MAAPSASEATSSASTMAPIIVLHEWNDRPPGATRSGATRLRRDAEAPILRQRGSSA
jgi:hypothetical protein